MLFLNLPCNEIIGDSVLKSNSDQPVAKEDMQMVIFNKDGGDMVSKLNDEGGLSSRKRSRWLV